MDTAFRVGPLIALALGAVIAIVGLITGDLGIIVPGVVLVLVALGVTRMKTFAIKAPGWEIGGESITPDDVATAAIRLANLRNQSLSAEDASRAAKELLPAPVSVTPQSLVTPLQSSSTAVHRAREALIEALAEHIVSDAGHYAYCPKCGFNHPIEQGEIVPADLRCTGCGTAMETTDRAPRGFDY